MTLSTNLPLRTSNRLHKLFLSFYFLLFGLSLTMAQVGEALDFDGVDDYVQLGNINLLSPFITIEAWVKPTEKTDFSTILSNKTGGLENPGYTFAINTFNSNDGKLVLESQGAIAVTDAKAITWGEWQHIAVTSDGMTAKFYVNGIEQAANNENTVNLVEAPNDGKIGDFAIYAGNGEYKGQLDELRIWGTVRSQLEIQDRMTCMIGIEPDLAVGYRFNQGIAYGDNTGMIALSNFGPIVFEGLLTNFALIDSTSNFVAPGGVSLICSEIAGGALDFNGMDNFVGIGDLQLTTGFTIEAWVRPEEKTDFSTIVSNKIGGLENPGYTFAINTFNSNDGRLVLETKDGFAFTDEQAITWGEWQHIAVTTDGLSAKFYVNGIEQAATTENTVNLAASPNTTNVGDFFEYFANGKFDGRMDELRVWNFIKTQTQIQDQMNCALVGDDPELLAYYNFDQGIAAGDNTSISMLEATTGTNGTLNGFGLLGGFGNFVIGEVEDVACMVSNTNELDHALLPLGDLFPNPSQQGEMVQVQLSSSQSAPLNIRIYNAIGQLMHQQSEAAFRGEQLIHIPSTDLTSGIYWVQFSQGDQLAQRKLVIQ